MLDISVKADACQLAQIRVGLPGLLQRLLHQFSRRRICTVEVRRRGPQGHGSVGQAPLSAVMQISHWRRQYVVDVTFGSPTSNVSERDGS
jgi:hypothetical protein